MDNLPYKKLYRSSKDKMIAGVCGGLADYFCLDPVWIRLIFIVLAILGGSSVLIYIILWLLVPKKEDDKYKPL